jgi:hypothetical protein
MLNTNTDLQNSEVQSLQAGEFVNSLSSSKESTSQIIWSDTRKTIFEYWIAYKEGKYTPDVWYQRLYRFVDIVNGTGHKWQRKLMASILKFEPLPFIWVNRLLTIMHIIDGGQRTRVIDGWFRNCIRLPKNTRVFYNGELLNLSEKNWSEIQKFHPQFADYWKNNYTLFFQEGDNLSDELCAEQFEKLNDGNEMSEQEFRTSIISDLNRYVLDKSNHESTTSLKCFQRKNLLEDAKKHFISKHHKINFAKRGFDAFVAKVFYMVMSDCSQPLSEKNITQMYYLEKDIEYSNSEPFNRKQKTQLQLHKAKVDKVLAFIDNLLMKDTSVSGSLSGNELFLLLHTKKELESKYELKITNEKEFLDTYRRFMKAFKADDGIKNLKQKQWLWVNSKGEPTSFSKSLSSIATGRPSEFKDWSGIVAGEFIKAFNKPNKGQKIGYELLPKKDEKRVYKISTKDSMASVQDFECMYFEYCGNHVDGIDESIAGDHSSTSHSKGGKTTISNGAACCTKCNGEKSSLSHDEFVAVLKIRGLSDDDIESINLRKTKVEEYAEAIA